MSRAASIRVADAETVNTELMLADLASLERRVVPLRKKAAAGDKAAKAEVALMDAALALLAAGKPARLADVPKGEEAAFRALNLLTAKPILYVANVEEDAAATGNRHSEAVAAMAAAEGAASVTISAAIEAEVALLPDAEEHEFLAAIGLSEPGLDRLIRAGYALLGLITFFTAGPKEVRAWTIPQRRQGAAGGRRHPYAISRRASSGRRRLPMTISSASAASRRRRKPARRATKARSTSSRTAT